MAEPIVLGGGYVLRTEPSGAMAVTVNDEDFVTVTFGVDPYGALIVTVESGRQRLAHLRIRSGPSSSFEGAAGL